ncbi:hypothetical protein KQI82_04450 [Oscillibacter sp. MSJ-2]|uniref:Uncharacterized protein n=1 Tax=Dysosmobacter acutus TaxID=2841504 RepID=A0ABS6F7Z2_9FIRM|nr:hypothetical protein [Dysosmobacter acutus]MBU5626173.1 hypothetical protein [Dysosmobacter acutus]
MRWGSSPHARTTHRKRHGTCGGFFHFTACQDAPPSFSVGNGGGAFIWFGSGHIDAAMVGGLGGNASAPVGLVGVWLAMCAELCIRVVLFLIRLLQGRWLTLPALTSHGSETQ